MPRRFIIEAGGKIRPRGTAEPRQIGTVNPEHNSLIQRIRSDIRLMQLLRVDQQQIPRLQMVGMTFHFKADPSA